MRYDERTIIKPTMRRTGLAHPHEEEHSWPERVRQPASWAGCAWRYWLRARCIDNLFVQLCAAAFARPLATGSSTEHDSVRVVYLAGGRFSSASVPSYIDLEQKRASLIPGPGEYNTAPKASGGQTWGKSSPPTAMDMLIRRANDSPAPWDTSRLKQQDVPGGKWSKTQSKSELDWIIHRAAKLPAPV
jgi:hypothetical protein